MSPRLPPLSISLLLALAPALVSCDLAQEARQEVVQRHRQQARGRVGVLRGMEVQQSAAAVSRRIQRGAREDCHGPRVDQPFAASLTLSAWIQTPAAEAPLASWEETRHFHRDQQGHQQVTWEVSFQDLSGRRSTWRRQQRLVEGWLYTAEQNLAFVRRRARPGDDLYMMQRAADAFPAAVMAGRDTWRLHPEGGYQSDGQTPGDAIRCGAPPQDEAWLARLLEVSELEQGRVFMRQGLRKAALKLRSAGPQGDLVVGLDMEEKILQVPPEAVEAPQQVASTDRDRPYRDVEIILTDKLGLAGWKKHRGGKLAKPTPR